MPTIEAAIYARTSGGDSRSCADQIDICRRRCHERGWRARFILRDEGYTGADAERPGYSALWEHIMAERVDVIVCWKIDRIARSLAELATTEEFLRQREVGLNSCTENIDTTTPQGRFMFGILASAGQLERELGSERVTSALRERARRGMWMHRTPPFGYCFAKGRSLRIHTGEAEQVRAVFRTHARSASYAETAALLNGSGTLRRGRRWTAGTIQRVICNPMYVGTFRHWGQETERTNMRILTDDEWQAAAAVRQENARSGKPASEQAREASLDRVLQQSWRLALPR